MNYKRGIGFILLHVGIVMILTKGAITGAVVGFSSTDSLSIIGILVLFIGLCFLVIENKNLSMHNPIYTPLGLKKQADAIKHAQPDAIGFFATASPTQELIRQVGVDFLANKVLFDILVEEPLRQFAKRRGIKIYGGSVVPNPKTSQLEIVKEYRQAMDRNNYAYDVFSLESYIGTSILIDMLQKIEKPITRAKIKQQLEALNNYQFKGLTLNFNPANRSLFDFVWIETNEDGEWVKRKVKN